MSHFNLFKSYDDVINAVIQPPKQEYHLHDLGPREVCIRKKLFRRTDLRLKNRRGFSIECSYFETHDQKGPVPCIIYLHANGCSRLEALQYMEIIGMNGMSLFCFDFSGSGRSEGPICSLGWFEQDDLECVINYLSTTGKVSSIAAWGRSMGAITALLYTKKDPRINCLVLDSPFINFKQFAKDFAKMRANIPGVVTLAALAILGSSVKSRAKFDIDKVDPLSHVPSTKTPAIFAAAQGDTFIPPNHSQELYENYGGAEKKLIFFEGDHNSTRPLTFLCQVMAFLREHLIDAKNVANTGSTYETTKEETEKQDSAPQPNISNNVNQCKAEVLTARTESRIERQQSIEQQSQQSDTNKQEDDTPKVSIKNNTSPALTEDQSKVLSSERASRINDETSNKQVESNTTRNSSVERKSGNERGTKVVFSWISEHSTSTPNLHDFGSQKKASKGEPLQPVQLSEPDVEIGAENSANNPNCTPIKLRKIDRSVTSVSFTMNRTSSAINLQQGSKEGQKPPRVGLPPSKINVRGISQERNNNLQQFMARDVKIETVQTNLPPEDPVRRSEDVEPLKCKDENISNSIQPILLGEIFKNPTKPTSKIIGLAKSNLASKSTRAPLIQQSAREGTNETTKPETIASNPVFNTDRTIENKAPFYYIPKSNKYTGSLKALRENLNPQNFPTKRVQGIVTRREVEPDQNAKQSYQKNNNTSLPYFSINNSLEGNNISFTQDPQKSSLNLTTVQKNLEEDQQPHSNTKYAPKTTLPRKHVPRVYSNGLFSDYIMKQKNETANKISNTSATVTKPSQNKVAGSETQPTDFLSYYSSYTYQRSSQVNRRRDNKPDFLSKYKTDQRNNISQNKTQDFSKLDFSFK